MTHKGRAPRVLGALCVFCLSAGVRAAGPPTCEPGYQIVEEVCYKEVVHCVCKVVPDIKKVTKPVHDCKAVEFCQLKCPGFHCKHGCDGAPCPDCGKVRTRTVLLKKFVTVEEPTCKCVVEKVIERVPYTVYHKVPCRP